MKCAVHTDVGGGRLLPQLRKAMCSICVRPVRDVLYCEECLAAIVGIPAPTPSVSAPVAEITISDARFRFASAIT